MLMTEYSASSFIGVNDVRQGPLQAAIADVEMGNFGKPILKLDNGDNFSLNKTNVRTLIRAYGEDSRDWVGCRVEFSVGQIEYQGQKTETVLVRPISPEVSSESNPQF